MSHTSPAVEHKNPESTPIRLYIIGLAGVIGFAALNGGALLAREVTLAPLLLFGAPVMLAAAAMKLTSPVAIGLLGMLLYAAYAAAIIAPQQLRARMIVALGLALFHIGSIFSLNLIPLLFGL